MKYVTVVFTNVLNGMSSSFQTEPHNAMKFVTAISKLRADGQHFKVEVR